MLANEEAFQLTNKLFEQIIPLENFQKNIIVIDKNNFHKETIMGTIKNGLYPYLEKNINISFMEYDKINFNIKNSIFCVPIAFDRGPIKEWIKLATNNIVIAAKDEEYSFPCNISNVIVADKNIHWAGQVNKKDTAITGTSAYCAFLSILALNGKSFLLDFIRKVDSVYGAEDNSNCWAKEIY